MEYNFNGIDYATAEDESRPILGGISWIIVARGQVIFERIGDENTIKMNYRRRRMLFPAMLFPLRSLYYCSSPRFSGCGLPNDRKYYVENVIQLEARSNFVGRKLPVFATICCNMAFKF